MPISRSPQLIPIFAGAALLAFGVSVQAAEEGANPPRIIAFGSCGREDNDEGQTRIWAAIQGQKPGLFLFLGDNIYGDSDDIEVIKGKYGELKAQPKYKEFRESGAVIMGTWDDHDYGRNDAGEEYPIKKESQQAFLDFFDVPKDSPLREREGIYHARMLGAEGKKLQVIMLDTRYFRSALKRGPKGGPPYVPDPDPEKTMLGAEQWVWLKEQLEKPADLRIIGSSIQTVPEEHGWEKWANLPLERDRLFKLIKDTKANGVILLSGDRHLAEISMLPAAAPNGLGYPLYDLTSSGLTHAGGGKPGEPNKWRVDKGNFRELNFGTISIDDWAAEDPRISMEIRNIKGEAVLSQTVPLSALKRGK